MMSKAGMLYSGYDLLKKKIYTKQEDAAAMEIDRGDGRDEMVISILQNFEENNNSLKENKPIVTIPRVPGRLHQDDNDAYEPRIISLGPYHRGKPSLQPMEKLKWRYLRALLERCKVDLTYILKAIEPAETTTRRCYSDHIHLSKSEFVEMMLLDGCFIVEYFLRGFKLDFPHTRNWMEPLVRNDMLLLENQLPFFLIEHIYFSIKLDGGKPLIYHVMEFCSGVETINTKKTPHPVELPLFHWHHLLHVYYSLLLGGMDDHTNGTSKPSRRLKCSIPSATFLDEVGVKFKNMEETSSRVIDVKFQNGLMEISPLFVDTYTIFQLRNFIAYEKLDPYVEPRFTAFIKLMDYLIDTSKDVALLRKNGIIEHAFGSDEEVATIFNQLNSGTLDTLPLEMSTIYGDVDKYCKTKRHRWQAILMRDYFGNPWKSISFVAAVILLSLTFLQTFFSMYSYFRPP